MTGPAPRPLSGLVVLELAHYAAGPFATMQLADAGARVIKVEQPIRGEHYRTSGTMREAADGSTYGAYFLRFNRNKESIELDLADPDGRRVFIDLCRHADALVTNLHPATLRRQELDFPSLASTCPRLVYTSISGFGHDDVLPGVYADRPAFASIAEALSGFMLQVGDPDCRPHRSGTSLADLAAGLYAAFGTTLALRQRDQTGRGQHVDVALYDAMLAFNERALFTAAETGAAPTRGTEGTFCPYDSYRTADGWIVVCVMTPAHWAALRTLLGRDDWATDDRFATGIGRARHRAEIDPVLQEWLAGRGAVAAAEELRSVGVPASEVRGAVATLDCPQAEARQMLLEIADPFHGTHRAVGNPMKLSDDLAAAVTPPPPLGSSTDVILHTLTSLSTDDIARLRAAGVVR